MIPGATPGCQMAGTCNKIDMLYPSGVEIMAGTTVYLLGGRRPGAVWQTSGHFCPIGKKGILPVLDSRRTNNLWKDEVLHHLRNSGIMVPM